MNIYQELLKSNILSDESIKVSDFCGDEIITPSLLAINKIANKEGNAMIIASNLYAAEQIRNFISSFLEPDKIIYLPSEELLAVEYLASSPDILCDRIFGLYESLNAQNKILITNINALIRFYPEVETFKNSMLSFQIGDDLDIKEFKLSLLKSGYELVRKVDKTGQVSFRGEIIDIFPIGYDDPVRIGLFDTEIDNISFFSVAKQKSFKKIQDINILPATDLLLSSDDEKYLEEKLFSLCENSSSKYNEIISNVESDIILIKNHNFIPRLYKYYGTILTKYSTVFDYFHTDYLYLSNQEEIKRNIQGAIDESNKFINELFIKGKNPNNLIYYNSNYIRGFKGTTINNNPFSLENNSNSNTRRVNFSNKNKESAEFIIKIYLKDKYKIIFCLETEHQRNFFEETILKNIVNSEEVQSNSFLWLKGTIPFGIDFVDTKYVILTPHELFGSSSYNTRYATRFRRSSIIKNYEDLEKGDYVVHEQYGIARFEEIKKMTVDNIENDYIKLSFLKEAKLYLPLSQIKLIRKYISREGYVPKLSSLFNNSWEKTKQKVKNDIDGLADDLINLYKERQNKIGFKYPKDDMFQEIFEKNFEYPLTDDQIKSVQEIKEDMENELPMDRLICGDVGFGKTEIAFRAAFKAINSGKQVLILCPTTILAKQHYERAIERFFGFDINIAYASRFISNTQFNKIIKDVSINKIHLLIGTHKVLSDKLIYNNLGLLIIDEEQRFGVKQKEKIRMKYKDIDTLTLSATPIPRTLQMSLVGMKNMSLVNTAPKNRTPIQTLLLKYNFTVIIDVIKKELGRKGQVYYINNNIDSLYQIGKNIKDKIPDAKISIIHGQMDKKDIEATMASFYNGEIDVLIATTIVENGIDVPNANLMIIDDADKFGLAQLYQLKGRVGRSNKLAYAYLMYRENKNMSENAIKRLKTISEFTELGSGYKIAQRDLMIRGAGDVLGAEQAGNINDVGIDLYLKFLNDSVKEKQNIIDQTSKLKNLDSNISISGFIPDKYATDEEKFDIYTRINTVSSLEDLDNEKEIIIDIYGKIPNEFINIIKVRELKIKLLHECFESYKEQKDLFVLALSKNVIKIDSIGSLLMAKLYSFSNILVLKYNNGVIMLNIKKRKTWLSDVNAIVDIIVKLYDEKKQDEIR